MRIELVRVTMETAGSISCINVVEVQHGLIDQWLFSDRYIRVPSVYLVFGYISRAALKTSSTSCGVYRTSRCGCIALLVGD